MPYNLEGVQWTAPVVTWSFADLRLESSLASAYPGYPSFDSTVIGDFRGAMRDAFNTWDGLIDLDFSEVSDSEQSYIRVGEKNMTGHSGEGVWGLTNYWYVSAGALTRAAIAFDPDTTDAHVFYLVALHEIGHALGLGHSDSPNDIMYPVVSGSLTGPSPDDIAGAQSLYGAETSGPAPTNHAPSITSNGGGDTAVVSMAENTTAVTLVTATDSDAGQVLAYSIVTGAGSPDAASFVLNPTTHALSFVTAPNFEAPTDSDHNNSYVVQVRVGDNGSPALWDTQTITVNVADVQQFQPLALKLGAFGANSGGWTSDDRYPRELADVNGDGLPDVVGFGDAGVFVSLGTGGGSFGPIGHRLAAFGANNGGWSSDDRSHRELADVNGDGMADIVGFGDAGVFVSLATGGGSFGPIAHRLAAFGTINGGWYSDDRYPRLLGDVNGDHMADIVGFGDAGVFVALATGGGGFGPVSHRLAAFGGNNGWISDNQYPRELADVNGDGMDDIIGFADAGVFVSLATGGGNFAAPAFRLFEFGRNEGWTTDDRYPRELADVNGDHNIDIVGFGEAGVSLALGNGDGTFQPLTPDLHAFGPSAGGWTSDDRYPRQLADINHDGSAEIVGFGDAGVWASFSTGFHLI